MVVVVDAGAAPKENRLGDGPEEVCCPVVTAECPLVNPKPIDGVVS